ncbi:MAG: glycosyltransferase family 1 protein [Candidatus Promineifilaceae bacterium]
MRVGIDCRLPYYQMGGISQYILQLLPALAVLDKENEYLIFHSRKDGRSYLPPHAPNFRPVDLWTPCHHRLERWSLSAELLPYNLDIYHSPDFIPPQWGGKKQAITIHDLNFLYYPQFLTADSRRYYAGQIEWAVRRADHVSADSHHTRQDLIERLNVPAEQVTAVPLAANPVYSRPQLEGAVRETLADFNLPSGFLLFVGTLEPRKNVPLLLAAYHQLLQEKVTDLPLVLVGRKGWLYDEIFDQIKQLDLEKQVRHLTGVNDDRLAHLYSAASLLALPSFYEGFGLPPLEAMHCGCPVIVSDRGSLPEIVGQAGIILPPERPEAWASAMTQLLTDEARRQEMIANGYIQAEKFSWQTAAAQTVEIYQNLTLT